MIITIGQTVYNTLILLLYNFLSTSVTQDQLSNEPKYLNIDETVLGHGYPFEEYQIKTQDGYLLTLHRIPHGRNSTNTNSKREVVYFQHGIAASSYDWLILGPDYALPYHLADLGYDVWLGNSRGNRYGRKHETLKAEEVFFWHFSYHEVGYYDIPAMIDFILKATQQNQVYFIGHSQGSTGLLVTASERPEYIKYIRLFIACAPVVHAQKMRSMLAEIFATFYKQIMWFINTFEYQEFLTYNSLHLKFIRLGCELGMPYYRLCLLFGRINFGYGEDLEKESITNLLHAAPGGSGIRQMAHYMQNKLTGSFSKYDHGLMLNYIKYGKHTPPKYNLRTPLPTSIVYSDLDWVSTVEDVERLERKLQNLKSTHLVHFGHVDYLYGRNSSKILLDIVVMLLNNN